MPDSDQPPPGDDLAEAHAALERFRDLLGHRGDSAQARLVARTSELKAQYPQPTAEYRRLREEARAATREIQQREQAQRDQKESNQHNLNALIVEKMHELQDDFAKMVQFVDYVHGTTSSDLQRLVLENLHRQNSKIDALIRALVVEAVDAKLLTQRAAATLIDVHENTVARWVKEPAETRASVDRL